MYIVYTVDIIVSLRNRLTVQSANDEMRLSLRVKHTHTHLEMILSLWCRFMMHLMKQTSVLFAQTVLKYRAIPSLAQNAGNRVNTKPLNKL